MVRSNLIQFENLGHAAVGMSIMFVTIGVIGLLFVAAMVAKNSLTESSNKSALAFRNILYKAWLLFEIAGLSWVAWVHPSLGERHWLLINRWHIGGGKPVNTYEWLQVFLVWAVIYFFLACYS